MSNMWERVGRLIGADNLDRLAEKRVGVVGLGSGGGFVALSLAMCGVGSFVLVDDDVLERGNITRHVADLRSLGQNKAAAVADLIWQRNPDARIDVRPGTIEDHWDCLDGLDLLVVAVDNEQVKYSINEKCLAKRLTASYAGVYERGEGGDHVIIKPYDGPCYACWAEATREGVKIAMNSMGDLDYGMIGADGTLASEPGLWVNVTKVAGIQTDLVLNELLRGTAAYVEMPANTLIISNTYLDIIEGADSDPHTGIWVEIERDPDCLVCGERLQKSLSLLARDEHASISLDDLAASRLTTDIVFEEAEARD
ncbi:MAG: ThiF family adenylyltransferase [Chloroflexi bacterium]|nr:ThiF family adenylyltransferase [Chloroflexota bacterium]MCY4247899.1 ThiF family adenylyltransferase [Chloroflexota bacterium]